ncbi:MAG: radical SAM protein [Candidatus Falkowbacteria bacterium]
MERVDIKVGFYCNNLCKFCVQGRKRDYLPAKDKEEVISSLKEAFDKGKREVVFTGGEPCLHPEFLFLVKAASEIGFEVIQIQTNGRMFAYENFCLKTIQAGANQFSPALHGHNAAIHDFLTEAPGSFKQTAQGIKNLKKLNQYVLTNSVITSKNYRHLPELARLLVDLGVDQFQFAFVHILGTADKNKDWLTPKKTDIMPFVRKGLDIGIKAGKKVTTEAIPFCFMAGYEKHVGEIIMPETRIYDAGFVVEDYGAYRRDSGKARREECHSCKYDKVCEGPWKEYTDLFGWDEFKPLKK